jgi:hypothetical protein
MRLSSARIIAAVLMSILFGWFMHHDYLRWNLRGREAFGTFQLRRFDHYMAVPQPLILTLLTGLFSGLIVLGVYELVALGLSKIFRDEPRNDKMTQV